MDRVCEGRESGEIPDDLFEVKVTVIVGLQYRGEHPGVRDALDVIYNALCTRKRIPDGSKLYGHEARVFDAKALRKRKRQIAKMAVEAEARDRRLGFKPAEEVAAHALR